MSRENAINLELPNNLRTGVYSNYFAVTVGDSEAVIDFGNNLPTHQPQVIGTEETAVTSLPIVVSRIILTRNGAILLRNLLDDLLKKTEPQNRNEVK